MTLPIVVPFVFHIGSLHFSFFCFSVLFFSTLKFPVDVPRGTMMHDFAITENFAVFLDLPMVLKTENVMKGKFPIVFDKAQDAR